MAGAEYVSAAVLRDFWQEPDRAFWTDLISAALKPAKGMELTEAAETHLTLVRSSDSAKPRASEVDPRCPAWI